MDVEALTLSAHVVAALVHARHRAVEPGERLADCRVEDLPRLGKSHRAAGTLDQTPAQLILELLDLMADGGWRHIQLLCGAGEIEMPTCGFEGFQRTGSREEAHGEPYLQKYLTDEMKTTRLFLQLQWPILLVTT